MGINLGLAKPCAMSPCLPRQSQEAIAKERAGKGVGKNKGRAVEVDLEHGQGWNALRCLWDFGVGGGPTWQQGGQ